MSLKSPTKAEFIANLDKIITRMLYIDRQTKAVVQQMSQSEYIWHETKAAAQRLRLESQQSLKEAIAMLNQIDPILNEDDEGPKAPSTPTNPNPWCAKGAIEIGVLIDKPLDS
ncbi:unnamed protein product [Fusarium graminearum]|nr:unnamed protein product [Fusarium graminearum]